MVRVMKGRSLDVVCICGDILSSTEFVLYLELQPNVGSDSGGDKKLSKVTIVCNGEEVLDSLNGQNDSIAVLDSSGRVAFIDPNGSLSYFPSDGILNDMKLRSDVPNTLEFRHGDSTSTLSTSCKVWLWDVHDNICIVDIDGTVTVEDVRGYVETVYLGVVSSVLPLTFPNFCSSKNFTFFSTSYSTSLVHLYTRWYCLPPAKTIRTKPTLGFLNITTSGSHT